MKEPRNGGDLHQGAGSGCNEKGPTIGVLKVRHTIAQLDSSPHLVIYEL